MATPTEEPQSSVAPRQAFGLVVAGALIGAFLGHMIPIPWDVEDPRHSAYQYVDEMRQRSHHRIAGAFIGAIIGMIIDTIVNGVPARSDFRFSMRTLFIIVLLAAFLCYAVQSYNAALRFTILDR
jgi:F0F1-type ATP synthase assembly protein I